MKQEMTGWQWHQLDQMQIICTSLQTDNHASTSSLNFLQARCSSWRPINSVKVLTTLWFTKKCGSTFVIITLENLGKIVIIFTYLETGMNVLCKQAIYLFILRDVNMTSLSRLWHWRSCKRGKACNSRWLMTNGQWPTRLRACVHANGGHSEHTMWLSIRFLSARWTSCFTPCLMQWVIV